MRQVFTSQRLETVEGVARFLEEHGIDTWTEQRRGYKGNRRHEFSYSDDGRFGQPAVWVVKSEDQPKARALLREAGLIETSRGETPLSMPPVSGDEARRRLTSRLRTVLLIVVVVLAAATSLRMLGIG